MKPVIFFFLLALVTVGADLYSQKPVLVFEAITSFVHRLQDSLFLRRRESAPGRVLAALMELHEEGKELTSENVAKKANESDATEKEIEESKNRSV